MDLGASLSGIKDRWQAVRGGMPEDPARLLHSASERWRLGLHSIPEIVATTSGVHPVHSVHEQWHPRPGIVPAIVPPAVSAPVTAMNGEQMQKKWLHARPGVSEPPPVSGSSAPTPTCMGQPLTATTSPQQLSTSSMSVPEPDCAMLVGENSLSSEDLGVRTSSAAAGASDQCQCMQCGKILSCPASLRRHAVVHSTEKPFSCDECGRSFGSAAYLTVHMRSHSGEKPFCCPRCYKCFTRSTGLHRHMTMHCQADTNSDPEPPPSAFQQTEPSAHHLVRSDTPVSQLIANVGTGQIAPSPVNMAVRPAGASANMHPAMGARGMPGSMGPPADRGFVSPGRPASGHSGVASYGTGSSQAPRLSSPSSPTTESGLKPVNINVASSRPKLTGKAQCGVCGKFFTRALSVKAHMRIHTGERPHKCHMCGKAFKNQSHLTVHLRTHSGERSHACPICAKGFAESSSLRRHMLVHTGERPYECEYCGKQIRYLSHLKAHRRKHTGEKPYQCEMCCEAFRLYQTYRLHVQKHNGELPTCPVCKKTFSNQVRLEEHVKIHPTS